MAGKNGDRLEMIVAIGTVVFMFLLIGVLNLGDAGKIFQGIVPQAMSEDTSASSEVSEMPPVELQPARSEFTVMGG